MELAGKVYATEFELVGEIAQLKLVALGEGFALEPVAAGPVGSFFPEVSVAKFAVALHGHGDAIGGEFHPDET